MLGLVWGFIGVILTPILKDAGGEIAFSKTFCHPKLKVLMECDKINETKLAYSLYMYLLYTVL